jgi:hypothetical protein
MAGKKIGIFGKADMNAKGEVGSEVPSWMAPRHLDLLEEEIRQEEQSIEDGFIPPQNIQDVKYNLKKKQEKLDELKNAKPKVQGKLRDDIAHAREELGEDISEAMFSRTEMKKGLANPHDEANRMSGPCIKIKNETMARVAKELGIEPDKKTGMVTRNQASRIWKIMSGLIDDETNTERLRKD